MSGPPPSSTMRGGSGGLKPVTPKTGRTVKLESTTSSSPKQLSPMAATSKGTTSRSTSMGGTSRSLGQTASLSTTTSGKKLGQTVRTGTMRETSSSMKDTMRDTSRRDKRLAQTQSAEDDRPKLKIIKTEATKITVEKKVEKPPEKAPEPAPEVKEEDRKKRQGRVRLYRGNMHLIQKANKEAAKSAMKGSKPKSGKKKKKDKQAGGRQKQRLIVSRLLRKVFGAWAQDEVILSDERSKAAVEALDLTADDLKKIRAVFEDIDIDMSGTIDVEELFEYLTEKRSPLTDALFAMMDVDGSGSMDFEEFMRVFATYCMYTEEDILRFCFDCFDKDGSGTIDEGEFISLCQTVNNADPMFSGNFHRALEEFDVDADGLVDFPEFCSLYRKYPMMLFPAFRLQDTMQRITLGHKGWKRIHESIEEQRKLLEYRTLHAGKDPPVPLETTGGNARAGGGMY